MPKYVRGRVRLDDEERKRSVNFDFVFFQKKGKGLEQRLARGKELTKPTKKKENAVTEPKKTGTVDVETSGTGQNAEKQTQMVDEVMAGVDTLALANATG